MLSYESHIKAGEMGKCSDSVCVCFLFYNK